MILKEVRVDRFGTWRDLTLPLGPGPLNVLYGPNETGKSTLVRLIRGVLFGFEEGAPGPGVETPLAAGQAGSLVCEHDGEVRQVHRTAGGASHSAACLIEGETARSAEAFLASALRGLDGPAFRSLLAIDLEELHALSSLPPDQAAQSLYGLSLGPAARTLLAAQQAAQLSRGRWVSPLQHEGELVRLFEREDELEAQLRASDRQQQRHAEHCRRRDELEQDIVSLSERRAGLGQQLRGHRWLAEAHGPWRRCVDAERELAELPLIAEFPEQGLERLERIESELASAAADRDARLAAARGLRERLQSGGGAARWQEGLLQGWVAQRGWLLTLRAHQEERQDALDEAQRQLAQALNDLGPDWTVERLSGLALTTERWQELSGAAQSLQCAGQRLAGLRRMARPLRAETLELRTAVADGCGALDERHEGSISAALTDARERLRQVKHLARLQLREVELQQRQYHLLEDRDRLVPFLRLPGWVHVLLGLFCFMGIVLAGWGLIAGVATSGIAGAIYALLGLTCGGLAWGLKAQYEGDARGRLADAEARLLQTMTELEQVRGSIRDVAGDKGEGADGAPAAEVDAGELVRVATERVAELFDLARQKRSLRQTQQRLKRLRGKLRIAREELDTARDAWGERLFELGLPETLSTGEALDFWQRLLDAAHLQARVRQAHESLDLCRVAGEAWRTGLEECRRRLGDAKDAPEDPLALLESWERRLAELAAARAQLRDGRRQWQLLRQAAAQAARRAAELKVERNALLVQGGAASRDEFELRAGQARRRAALVAEASAAQRELDHLANAQADLALVEEDLVRYDATENQRCLEALEREAADLERELDQARQSLDETLAAIHELERDRQPARVRREREHVRQQLRDAVREWAAVETAAQTVDELRCHYERRHQPPALEDASRRLARLTRGRYQTVWAPLGERRLMVEDESGRALPVSSLSRGAREQLFLAVRLALIDDLARQGTTLPLLLDDVFVNFDDARAEAAADVLLDFAREGRQVLLFTCHLHLARLFQSRGVEPIWLPDATTRDEREAPRRAG